MEIYRAHLCYEANRCRENRIHHTQIFHKFSQVTARHEIQIVAFIGRCITRKRRFNIQNYPVFYEI